MAKAARITVDARCLDGTKNGYAAYTSWVVSVLQSQGHTVELISNRSVDLPAYPAIKPTPISVFGSRRNLLWEQINVRGYLQRVKPEAYFCGQNIGLPLNYRGSTRLVLGLLDLIPERFPEHYIRTLRDRFRYHYMQPANARTATQILTISKASEKDIKKYLGVKKVKSIYIRQEAPAQKLRLAPLPTEPTFVYAGGVEWRKQLAVLVGAFEVYRQAEPTARLILIGDGYATALAGLPGVHLGIEQPGRVSEAERSRLLRSSSAAVCPSLYEGYGLPIAEALLVGLPVICGQGGSQPEVGGQAALYVDPTDRDELVRAMQKVTTAAWRKKVAAALPEREKFLTDPALDRQLLKGILG